SAQRGGDIATALTDGRLGVLVTPDLDQCTHECGHRIGTATRRLAPQRSDCLVVATRAQCSPPVLLRARAAGLHHECERDEQDRPHERMSCRCMARPHHRSPPSIRRIDWLIVASSTSSASSSCSYCGWLTWSRRARNESIRDCSSARLS